MFNLKRKVLFGLSASIVLAMAIGSFALSETQTPASPQEVEAQSAVGATFGPFTVEGGTQGTDFDYTSPVLTIHSGDLTVSTSAQTAERIVVDGAATITLAGVNIDRSSETENAAALTITDNATFNVNILLADGSTNILKSKVGDLDREGSPGIQKSDDGTIDVDTLGMLTIGVPEGSAGTGKMEATGGYRAAGIGGGYQKNGSKITITGGEVIVTGGWKGAGIGGGSDVDYGGSDSDYGRYIEITGGEVTVNAVYGAGIGGGFRGNASNITINGGVVTTTSSQGAGIGGGYYGSASDITITGGIVTASGDYYGRRDLSDAGAGIGGGQCGSGSNITISGGVVKAIGGYAFAAGIGGGNVGSSSDGGNASNITITGGEVTAIGGQSAAGIGSGGYGAKNASNITISGGVVRAYGGQNGAGIGSGGYGTGSNNNSINGNAVVLATSGSTSKAALEGFIDADGESLITKGIVFTGVVTTYDSSAKPAEFSWDPDGVIYDDSVIISQNVEFPANLTIEDGKEITLEAGKTLAISAGATLTNEGIFNIGEGGSITCQYDEATGTTGEVTTKTDFYREGSTDVYATGYQTYQTSAGVQKYTNLPNPDQTNDNGFVNWYYIDQDGKKIKIDENSFVTLNAHSFYENLYSISVAELENGSVTPDVTGAAKDDTVTLTVTPDEGYQLKEGSLTVTDADGNEVSVTEQDGKYTFTMPGADVTVSAAFELIPEPEPIPDPSIEPGHGGDGSSKTGDSFAGIAALAIFGVATTGAVLVRKRK